MERHPNATNASGAQCRPDLEEALNAYVDGELSDAAQKALFLHLAHCDSCRHTLDSVLNFRRMSRQEYLAVPPSVDEAVMQRLARHRDQQARVNRSDDRRPLWSIRLPMTLRVALLLAAGLFLVGLLSPISPAPEPLRIPVAGEEELIRFSDVDLPPSRFEAVYVFYPGLTIEAATADETPVIPGSL